jgi:hypothetical protein
LLVGEADVPLQFVVDRLLSPPDLFLGYHEGFRVPAVEALRVTPHGGDTLLLHRREDFTHRVSNLLGYTYFLRSRLLQVLHLGFLLLVFFPSLVQIFTHD